MMISVDVVRLPSDLKSSDLIGKAVVVFDVLRATSTIVTALANGAVEVRAFGSLDLARAAWEMFGGRKLLAGEKHCLPPEGFDIGNSPGDFSEERVRDRVVFLSTTNGTRAIVAAERAERMFVGSLLNATATAHALAEIGLPVTLLCSGTEGKFSEEDFLGAGAVAQVLDRLASDRREQKFVARASRPYLNMPRTGETPVSRRDELQTDQSKANIALSTSAVEAVHAFELARDRPAAEMRKTISGHNLRLAKLESDIDFSARLDSLQVVAEVIGVPPVIRRVMPTASTSPSVRARR